MVSAFPWGGSRMHTETQEHELEQLACSVLEFGNMKYQVYRNQRTVVDVTELALRLRETPRDIKRTLKLLEKQGLAKRTDLPSLWQLHVSNLDQHSPWLHPTDPRRR